MNDLLKSIESYVNSTVNQSGDTDAAKSLQGSIAALNTAWLNYEEGTGRVLKAVDAGQPDEAVKLILVGGDLFQRPQSGFSRYCNSGKRSEQPDRSRPRR